MPGTIYIINSGTITGPNIYMYMTYDGSPHPPGPGVLGPAGIEGGPFATWSSVYSLSTATPVFAVSGSGRLVLMIVNAWDNGGGFVNFPPAIVDTAGLTWNSLLSAYTSPSAYSAIFWANPGGAVGGTSVTATWTSNAPVRSSVHAMVLTGTNVVSPLGGSTTACITSATTSKNMSLTCQAERSILIGSLWVPNGIATAGEGSTITNLAAAQAGSETWAVYRRNAITSAGEIGTSIGVTCTYGSASPTGGVLAEILAG